MKLIQTVSLYDTSPGHDKFYTASITEHNGSFSVPFTYGPISGWRKGGEKASNVSEVQAQKVFDKLVSSKLSKGYYEGDSMEVPICDGVATQVQATTTPAPKAVKAMKFTSGPLGQLLDQVEESQAKLFIEDDNYCAQQKHDGRRRLVRFDGDTVTGFNKKGQESGYVSSIAKEMKGLAWASGVSSFLLDGEEVGDTFYVFDLLEKDGDIRSLTYQQRYDSLKKMLNITTTTIVLVQAAFTTSEKRKLFESLKLLGAEGIVFKRIDGTFKAGHGTGDHWKYKFYDTASFVVLKRNAKRSVELGIYEGSSLVGVGNCTIPPNKDIPDQDEVIEVRYLYAFKGGKIYQPTYLGVRDDTDREECVVSQLKYKGEAKVEVSKKPALARKIHWKD